MTRLQIFSQSALARGGGGGGPKNIFHRGPNPVFAALTTLFKHRYDID